MKKLHRYIVTSFIVSLMAFSARADLTLIITPGHIWTASDFTNQQSIIDALNAAAAPTGQIVGSVGGSNSVAPGSITLVQLSSSILDAKTLNFLGSGGTIQIAVQGVATNNFNTNDWGWPLAQPTLASPVQLNFDPILFRADPTNTSGGLSLDYDPNFFATNATTAISTNRPGTLRTNATGLTLHFSTNSLPITLTNGATTNVYLGKFMVTAQTNVDAGITNIGPSLDRREFVSGLLAVVTTSGKVEDISHGLGFVPQFVRWVCVCTNAGNNYTVGDEVALVDMRDHSNGGNPFNEGANSTNLFLVHTTGNTFVVGDKSTGNDVVVSSANWALRCYAW